MQQSARIAARRAVVVAASTYVSPVRAVERVRIRARLRRARTGFVPLYLAAGAAGVACGFFMSMAG